MKKKKEITYNTLVRVAKQVLLTIKIDDPSNLYERDNKMRLRGCQSKLYLFGGRAPDNIEDLLTYNELFRMRGKWMKKMYRYFKIFIPDITQKKMWKVIIKQRTQSYNDDVKRSKREKIKEIDYHHKDGGFYPMADRINGNERLFPLSNESYLKFIATVDKVRLIKDKEEYDIRRIIDYDSSHYERHYIFVKKEERIRNYIIMGNHKAGSEYFAKFGERYDMLFGKGKLHILAYYPLLGSEIWE